jgi:hypothetical protein
MRINTTNVSANKSTKVAHDPAVKSKIAFSPRMEAIGAAAKKDRASLIGHDQLMALAADFKTGLLTKEQANERFVGAVVESSIKGKLTDKDRETIAKDISNFFADDPDFMNKLQKNLRDLA